MLASTGRARVIGALALLLALLGVQAPVQAASVETNAAHPSSEGSHWAEGDASLAATEQSGVEWPPGQATSFEILVEQGWRPLRDVTLSLISHVTAPEQWSSVEVPVPGALWLFGSGIGLLGMAGRRIGKARRRASGGGADTCAPKQTEGERYNSSYRYVIRNRLRQADPAHTRCKSADNVGRENAGHGSGDGRGPSSPAPCFDEFVRGRFDELAFVLCQQPDVTVGRSFGRPCVKLGKRAFLVCDETVLAYRVGEQNAIKLRNQHSSLDLWNPKAERQPKTSWIATCGDNAELLVMLAAAAYELALTGEGMRRPPEQVYQMRDAESPADYAVFAE